MIEYQNLNQRSKNILLEKRFIAFVLDSFLAIFLGSFPFLFFYFKDQEDQDMFNVIIAFTMAIILAVFYFLTKDGLIKGQSVGKKVMGIIVIYLPTNRPCSIIQSVARNIFIVISFFGLPIEPFVILISKDRRGLGDYIAKTQVIYRF